MKTPTLPQDETAATGQAPAAAAQRSAAAPGYRTGNTPARPLLALPALATAGLLYLCYFPVAWGWLGWVALVPILSLTRANATPGRVFFWAWVAGLAFFWPVLSWMPVADHRMYYTWAALATYCSLYFPVGILLIRRLDRDTPLPLVVTVPLVWVGLEFVRSFLLTGFAWYYLGHTQHQYLAVIQVSDLGGAYAVSLLVAAVSAWLFEALYAQDWFRGLLRLPGGDPATAAAVRGPTAWRPLGVQATFVVGLVVAALVYGGYRLHETTATPGPRLALLQGNLDQRLRNAVTANRAAGQSIYNYFGTLCVYALPGRPDLVVWPETSYPMPWVDIPPSIDLNRLPEDWLKWERDTREAFEADARGLGVDALLGLNTFAPADETGKRTIRYNSALLMRAAGLPGGRYDKLHRVPFGEYVPLRDWLPFMDHFAPYETDYSITAGTKLTRFDLATKHRFGVLVCYEDTDPFLARQYGRATDDGPAVDFLVNISNDGWFDGSSEHDEHLAVSRFRAIEARRALARSVNMGISAIIDGNGRVLKPAQLKVIAKTHMKGTRVPGGGEIVPEDTYVWAWTADMPVEDLPVSEWSRFKKVRGVLTADIPIDGRSSLYSQWGDWLAGSCLGATAVCWGFARVSRRRRLAAGGAS